MPGVLSTAGGTSIQPLKKTERKDIAAKKAKQPSLMSLENLALQIQQLAKNLANPKDKEKYLELRERHYRAFLLKINKSNSNNIQFPTATFTPYKFYIGRGNNS